MREWRPGTPSCPRRAARPSRPCPIRVSRRSACFGVVRSARDNADMPIDGPAANAGLTVISCGPGALPRRLCPRKRGNPRERATTLTRAFLGNAGERVAQAVERVDVAGGGAAGRLAVDLHGAGFFHSLEQFGLSVRLLDKSALVLGEQVEFRGAHGEGGPGAVAEGIAHLDAHLVGDVVGRPARNIEVDRPALDLLGRRLLRLRYGETDLWCAGGGIGRPLLEFFQERCVVGPS